MAEGEARASAQQLSLDRLHLALAKATETETSLQEKARGLSAALLESKAHGGAAQEKALELQKVLTASEHERRVLQVCLGQGGQPLPPAAPVPQAGISVPTVPLDDPCPPLLCFRSGGRWPARPCPEQGRRRGC